MMGEPRITRVRPAPDPLLRDRLAYVYAGEPRVFLPGDDIPVGIWVMGRDRQPTLTWAPGKVRPDQPWGLVEVLLPDYERAFELGYARRFNESEAS